MITMFHLWYKDDPYNKNSNRNLSNTDRKTFNCGGYALGTFSWYCPHSEEDLKRGQLGYDYSFTSQEEAWEKTMYCVSRMILDFEGNLRVIERLAQLDKKTERAVAFRLSADGDFHYIKKSANGHWHHKRGRNPLIWRMSEYNVFHTDWYGRYNGPIVLLAIKK